MTTREGYNLGITGTMDVTTLTLTGETISGAEGTTYNGEVATFTDSTSGLPAGDYAANIDWGDGNSSPGVISYNSSTGTFSVTGVNTFATAGTLSAIVTLTDTSGASVKVTDTAGVTGTVIMAAELQPTRGGSFSGVLATFTDTDPADSSATYSDYTALIDPGTGT